MRLVSLGLVSLFTQYARTQKTKEKARLVCSLFWFLRLFWFLFFGSFLPFGPSTRHHTQSQLSYPQLPTPDPPIMDKLGSRIRHLTKVSRATSTTNTSVRRITQIIERTLTPPTHLTPTLQQSLSKSKLTLLFFSPFFFPPPVIFHGEIG
jgi:hypothetical protein